MNTVPTLDELHELHKRSTYYVVRAMLKGVSAGHGWWLYSKDGCPGTSLLPKQTHAYPPIRKDEPKVCG